MSGKHTPEPWMLSDKTEHGCCYDASFTESEFEVLDDGRVMTWRRRIGKAEKADAKRIVACVNGCVGINPESVTYLLHALKRMLAAHDADVANGSLIAAGNSQAADEARAAILKAIP